MINQRSYWFLIIIVFIWEIIIVVNVIIIAVVIIIIVNVKEMYTSHGLFCSTVDLAVFFTLTFPLFPNLLLSRSLFSSSPVPSRFFSCPSLLFNLESTCHCWYIAYYFFIGERNKARQNKKKNPKITFGVRLFFLSIFFLCLLCN